MTKTGYCDHSLSLGSPWQVLGNRHKGLWRKKNIYRLRTHSSSLSISCHGPLVDVHWPHHVPLALCFSWQQSFYWPLSQSKLFNFRQRQTTKFDPILISQSLGQGFTPISCYKVASHNKTTPFEYSEYTNCCCQIHIFHYFNYFPLVFQSSSWRIDM